MAQSQSQQPPQQPPASQSFSSPPVSSPSPVNAPSPAGITAPPAKRPRLSPAPQPQQQPLAPQQSFGSPSFGTLQFPKGGSPVNGAPTTSDVPNPTIQTPTPAFAPSPAPAPVPAPPPAPAPPGSMGPPTRPADKSTDAAELTDVLASSGIDVKEEEAFLTQGYGHGGAAATAAATTAAASATAAPSQPPRLQTSFNASFTSQGSGGTLSAGNSFTEQTPTQQTPLAPYAPPPPAPPPSQNVPQPQPQSTQEEVAEDARQRQDTAASRRAQYHLQDPFLNTTAIESQLSRHTDEVGIKLPTQGVYRPVPDQPPITVDVAGPDGSSVVRTGRTIMDHGATLGDIISLISLACEERLRSVIDHSAALAENRRRNSNGVVPDEWADLAATTSPPDGDKVVDGAGSTASPAAGTPKKRSISAVDQDSEPNSRKAVKLPNTLALQSHKVSDKDSTYEEKREAKRVKRNSDAIVAGGDAKSGSASNAGAATPTSSERAPEPERKVTKKEQRKADSRVPDAVQHQQAVETARMAAGNLFGSKKKQYSWLNSPAPARPGLPSAAKPSSAAGAGSTATTKGGAAARASRSRFGEWREDGKQGSGIQIKDILFMLEVDGTASKPIQKGYSKQTREELDRPVR